MTNRFTENSPLISLSFLNTPERLTHYHENVELVFVLHGNGTFRIDSDAFTLYPDDLLIINSGVKHTFDGSDDMLIARFEISYLRTAELLERERVVFGLNSAVNYHESYAEMREIIRKILNQTVKSDSRNHVIMQSLHYRLLFVLSSNFLLTEKSAPQSDETELENRMQSIMRFIRMNYSQPLSLSDLADKFYLSKSYISKYIIRHSGSGFTELLTDIRLNHALDELKNTDSSILSIAFKNGFPSAAAFNKAFKDAHSTTPSQYRLEYLNKNFAEKKSSEIASRQVISEKVAEYLQRAAYAPMENVIENKDELNISVSDLNGRPWKRNSNVMINIGSAYVLNNSNIREHVLFLKERLRFKYVRFWDIYSSDMLIDIHSSGDGINFGRLDSILDFLIENNLKPYVELGFKPLRLLKNPASALLDVQPKDMFASYDEAEKFYHEFAVHLVKRYGEEEVGTWYFELWKSENIVFNNQTFEYTPFEKSHNFEYFKIFSAVSKGIKRVCSECKIGGGGFSVQHYGQDGLKTIFAEWQNSEYRPDFISLNCFPYQLQLVDDKFYEKKSTDSFFLQHQIYTAREALRESKLDTCELHVSEFSLSLSNRNVVNDSCLKAAFVLQTMISVADKADVIGYWLGSDIYADYSDTQKYLFGGCGLLTKTKIPKPVFFSLQFMRMLSGQLLASDKHYLLSSNGRNQFKMVCHNFSNFGYNYFLSEEDKITVSDVASLSESDSSLVINLKLKGILNGRYDIKIFRVNTEYGSVQDEISRLLLESLSNDEQDYLRHICTPRLETGTVVVDSRELAHSIHLSPVEIRFVQISLSD